MKRGRTGRVKMRSGSAPVPAPGTGHADEHTTTPELTPEDGWVPIDLDTLLGRGCAFVSGPGNGNRVRVRYYRCDPAGTLAGKVWFGPDAEGRPGHAHSGSLAAVLEDAMGVAAWLSGFTVVPITATVHYHESLPLGLVCTIGSWVSVVDGDKIHTRALLAVPAGRTFAEAEGQFLLQDPPNIDRASGCGVVQAGSPLQRGERARST
jgi:hypothetical protein